MVLKRNTDDVEGEEGWLDRLIPEGKKLEALILYICYNYM